MRLSIEKTLEKYRYYFYLYFKLSKQNLVIKRPRRTLSFYDKNLKKHVHTFKEGMYFNIPDEELYKMRIAHYIVFDMVNKNMIEENELSIWLDEIIEEVNKNNLEQLEIFTWLSVYKMV